MSVAQKMEEKLRQAFAPEHLEVVDDSEAHRGHGGYRQGGETHFNVVIRAEAFNQLSRVERQRAVNRVLAEELAGPVHALGLKVSGTA